MRSSPPAAADTGELSLASAVRVFPGPFLAGYASVKVVVQFWQAGLVAITLYMPGRGLERQPRGGT